MAYPVMEVLIKGLYCKCQVLTKPDDDGNWPKYVAVNSLEPKRLGEFIATMSMGCWMTIPMFEVADLLKVSNE